MIDKKIIKLYNPSIIKEKEKREELNYKSIKKLRN